MTGRNSVLADIDVPEKLRPRIFRKLNIPLSWDMYVDALPSLSFGQKGYFGVTFCRIYRKYRPKFIGDRCAYEPSCSRYSELCVREYGLWASVFPTISRLKRCNHQSGGIDLPHFISDTQP